MQPTPEVIDNIRTFVRLTVLTINPKYTNRFRSELDLVEAIKVLQIYFDETKRMIGKKMYRGQPFDVVEDVKRAMEEYFLTGRNEHESVVARSRNLNMYYLVIVPIIEMFKVLSHDDMIKELDETLAAIKEVIMAMDLPTHYDDGIVALAHVGDMIKIREQARKQEISKRKRGKRNTKKYKLLDYEETEIMKEDEDSSIIALSF
jgi:hypothetical protein